MSNLVIKITGDANNYVASLKTAEDSTGSFTNTVVGLNQGLELAQKVFGAVYGAIEEVVGAYKEAEKANNQLTQAMKSQGIFSETLLSTYKEQASELQNLTGISDENILNSQRTLQAYVGNRAVTQDLTKATLDFATALGTDAASAAQTIGKAIDGNVGALSRYGITIDENLSKQERMVAIQEALNQKFGGQAEAAGAGLGALNKLKEAYNDLQEEIGKKLAPAIEAAAIAFTNIFNGASEWIASTNETGKASDATSEKIEKLRNQIKLLADQQKMGAAGSDNAQAQIDQKLGLIQQLEEKQEQAAQREMQRENAKNQALNEANNKAIEEKEAAEEAAHQKELEDKNRREQEKDEYSQAWFEKRYADLEQRKLKEGEAQKLNDLKEAEQQVASNNRKLQDQAKFSKTYAEINAFMHSAVYQGSAKAFGELEQLQTSSNNTLKSIGKAAAIANIVIKTGESAMNIFNGFSTIPIVGIGLGIAGAAAAVAFGFEQIGKVQGAAQGGLITGPGTGTSDSIPAMLSNGELVVPAQNFEEVVDSVAGSRTGGGGGMAEIVITLQDNLMDFIEAKLVERQNLGISIQGA